MKTLCNFMVGILMLLALVAKPVTARAVIDTTQPTTSATLTGTKGSDGWYTASVTVTLAASDGADGSGVAKTEYSFDNMTWLTYSAPLVLDKDGRQYVYFRSTDLAENVESPAKSQEIKINKTGLVGWWKMDGDWKDSSVMGNNGTPYNGATFSTNGKMGIQAGSFDGVNDYVSLGNVLNMGSNNFAIAAWINAAEFKIGDGAKIINKGLTAYGTPPSTGFGLRVVNESGVNKAKFMVYGIGAGYVIDGSGLQVGKWYHLVGVREGTTIKLYINGLLAGTKNTGSILNVDTNLSLAISALQRQPVSVDGEFFHGLIDEASIYNRALSDTEVQEYYRKNAVGAPTVNPVPSPTATPTITLSGTKPANTAIAVNGNTLVPLDGTTTWQASYTLSAGTNNLYITSQDGQNFNSLPAIQTIVLDTMPPAAPTIDSVPVQTNTTSSTITGTKSSDSSSVVVNCAGVIGTISYPTATTWSVIVSGLKEGSNTITAYAVDLAGNPSSMATGTITVDTIPPALVATPAGGIYKSTQSITLATNEQTVIYYTLDGSSPTVGATLYSQPISVPESATLKYLARDLAGNHSEVKTENYVIDTTLPALAISTLSDGAYTNNEILNIAGTATDDTGIKGITVSGTVIQVYEDGSFSHALLLKNGVNGITIAATDSAGNMATDTRTVILDQAAPVLAVTTPADNSKTGNALLEVSGTVDETSTVTVKVKDIVQSAVMNGGGFTTTINLQPGYNTIEIAATDLAGNQSTLKRTVVFDDQVPSLAVIAPNQDVRTNQSSLTIKGTVSDPLTAVGVTIRKDNETISLPVIDGTFEQVVNFAEEKTYGIVVTATNEVGTSASIQRNIIYDATPPVLSIDPVPTPTSRQSLSVTGTREAGTAVTVTCATATAGEVSYPTATTWLADIYGLTEGENIIAAASADAAGNAVTATTMVVLASRPPQIMIVATPDVIWPPNHQLVPVTIDGGVDAYGADIESVSISVRDEYGKIEYKDLSFGSTVMLEAWRNGNDKDGREYTITVVVTDKSGGATAKTATVTVPHDEPKSKGYILQPPTRRKNRSVFR